MLAATALYVGNTSITFLRAKPESSAPKEKAGLKEKLDAVVEQRPYYESVTDSMPDKLKADILAGLASLPPIPCLEQARDKASRARKERMLESVPKTLQEIGYEIKAQAELGRPYAIYVTHHGRYSEWGHDYVKILVSALRSQGYTVDVGGSGFSEILKISW